MKSILITGASGFLGSHLLKDFIKKKYHVVALVRSTSNLWRIDELKDYCSFVEIDKIPIDDVFNNSDIDMIVHTACSYGRQGESNSSIVETNLNFGLRLLEKAIDHGVETFINTDTLLPRNVNAYSLSKAQLRDWLGISSNLIQIVNLKIEHMYGPVDDDKKFLPWLIKSMSDSKEVIELTSGEQQRNFIYIGDIVRAFDLLIERRKSLDSFTSFDIATDNILTVKDFITYIAEEIELRKGVNIKNRLYFGAKEYRKNDIMVPEFDNSQIKSLGWKPLTDYRQGIKYTLDYYL